MAHKEFYRQLECIISNISCCKRYMKGEAEPVSKVSYFLLVLFSILPSENSKQHKTEVRLLVHIQRYQTYSPDKMSAFFTEIFLPPSVKLYQKIPKTTSTFFPFHNHLAISLATLQVETDLSLTIICNL